MTKPVRLDVEAEEELASARDRYNGHVRGLGDDFVDVVDELLSRIGELPKAFPFAPRIAPRLRVRRAIVPGFPFAVFFIELRREIRILAVAHQHRRTQYWAERARRSRPQ